MKALRALSLLSLILVIPACGGDDDNPPAADAADTTPDAGGSDATPYSWTPLITGDWDLQAGTENWLDYQRALTEDIYITAIRPIAPLGTHHTLLSIGSAMDGNVIYASGVGTNEIIFPEGVGLHLTAGQTLNLQLHLFNTGDTALGDTSGVEVVLADAADVTMEADIFLPGPFDFSLAPMTTTTHSGTCTVAASYQIFALFPHMHQLGSYFKASINVGGTVSVLHDADYSFYDQAFRAFAPIQLSPGDTITTECTWDNTTDATVGWGNSSNQEMCFSILYRFPAQQDAEFCIN